MIQERIRWDLFIFFGGLSCPLQGSLFVCFPGVVLGKGLDKGIEVWFV